jgi:hypothetical protein
MQDFVAGEDARTGMTAEGFDEDAITVVLVEYEDVIVAAVGGDDELVGLVGVDLAGRRFEKSGETLMGASVGRVAGREGIIIFGRRRRGGTGRDATALGLVEAPKK